MWPTYQGLNDICRDISLPAVLVDEDQFVQNARVYLNMARKANKKIRVATKSIRVPHLIKKACDIFGDQCAGLMCYSLYELSLLYEDGHRNFLMAYPIVQMRELDLIKALLELSDLKLTLMVDHEEHLKPLIELQKKYPQLPTIELCLDVDVSFRPFGGLAHLGVRRSSLNKINDVEVLIKQIKKNNRFNLVGIMGYEAQIAGLSDNVSGEIISNKVKQMMKDLSWKDVVNKRRQVRELVDRNGIELSFFNGGGSGSIHLSLADEALSEVTVGSGLLQSHIFTQFQITHTKNAILFGLRITRKPDDDIYTCRSGGFIASGATGSDKNPHVAFFSDLFPLKAEGFGEVQTPFKQNKKLGLKVGDALFFRPAKAGEIGEQFLNYYLFKEGSIYNEVKTYRGFGFSFF